MSFDFQREIRYIQDSEVDSEMDAKIRKILTTCFPSDEVFQRQRFWNDLPQHRFFIEMEGEIIAHLGVHERQFSVDGVREWFIGLAELCIMPDYRRQNWAKDLISHVENKFSQYDFSLLMGESKYYSSSGYNYVANVIFSAIPQASINSVMVKCLKDKKWPNGEVIIDGLPF